MRSAKERKEMEDYLKDKHGKNQAQMNTNMINGVGANGSYLTPFTSGDTVINGRVLSDEEKAGLMSGKYELENSITGFNNRNFKDPIEFENREEDGLTFGGKKVRRTTKKTKKKRGGRIKRRGQKTRRNGKGKKRISKKTRIRR